jgi:single-strand DNA-binding protein
MSFQKTILCGEVDTQPELRHTQAGTPCCAFRLKTVETWMGGDGSMKEEVETHRVIVWGRDAERAAKELKKGSMAVVEGRLKTRHWMAENGHNVEIVEVVAVPNGVRFPGGLSPASPEPMRAKAPAHPPENKPAAPSAKAPPALPKEREKKQTPIKPAPPKPDKVPVDLSEADDLPF